MNWERCPWEFGIVRLKQVNRFIIPLGPLQFNPSPAFFLKAPPPPKPKAEASADGFLESLGAIPPTHTWGSGFKIIVTASAKSGFLHSRADAKVEDSKRSSRCDARFSCALPYLLPPDAGSPPSHPL